MSKKPPPWTHRFLVQRALSGGVLALVISLDLATSPTGAGEGARGLDVAVLAFALWQSNKTQAHARISTGQRKKRFVDFYAVPIKGIHIEYTCMHASSCNIIHNCIDEPLYSRSP